MYEYMSIQSQVNSFSQNIIVYKKRALEISND